MFDWNDQELANIIWGEACESDDHIVPFPEATDDYRDKKEHNQESSTIKSTEQKAPGGKVNMHGREPESSSNIETGDGISTSGFGTDSWPDLSLSSFEKTEQHCMAEANQLDKGAEIFQHSDEAKEQFVDYGWANIGSFDDLDQIFSNDDSIFSNASLGNVDELWSSRDATNSPIKTLPATSDSPSSGVRNVTEHSEIKTEHVRQDECSISPGYGKTDYSASHCLENAHRTPDNVEYAVGKSMATEKEQTGSDLGNSTVTNSYQAAVNSSSSTEIPDKVSRQRMFRSRKKLEDKNEGKSLQDFYGNWSSTRNPSGQYDNQLPSLMVQSSPSSVLGKKRQHQGPVSFPYQHASNQFVSQTMYGTLTNACQAMAVPSHIQPGQIKPQKFLSGSDVSVGSALNKSANTCAKPPTMTTQEKIEKLRRRQQLQAMLAIKKQQQQFSHQVPCTNQPTMQKCPQENLIQHSERADLEVEDLSILPSVDPNSHIEQDDSNTVSAAVEYYSAEDTILCRLQDIISKLDIKTRLCIRDSLLRLAHSAVQRNHTSDMSSSNKNSKDEPETVAKEEISGFNRYTSMPDVETETNPIDRTVAHLLFHRPLDLSGKHLGPPESPASKMPCERKPAGLTSLSSGVMVDSLKNKSNYSCQESGNYCPDPEAKSADHNFPCMNKSENLSNNRTADGGIMEVEASN